MRWCGCLLVTPVLILNLWWWGPCDSSAHTSPSPTCAKRMAFFQVLLEAKMSNFFKRLRVAFFHWCCAQTEHKRNAFVANEHECPHHFAVTPPPSLLRDRHESSPIACECLRPTTPNTTPHRNRNRCTGVRRPSLVKSSRQTSSISSTPDLPRLRGQRQVRLPPARAAPHAPRCLPSQQPAAPQTLKRLAEGRPTVAAATAQVVPSKKR